MQDDVARDNYAPNPDVEENRESGKRVMTLQECIELHNSSTRFQRQMTNSDDTFLRGVNDGVRGFTKSFYLGWTPEDQRDYERGYVIGFNERKVRQTTSRSTKKTPLTVSSASNISAHWSSPHKVSNTSATLWDFQEDILEHEFTKHPFNIVKKDRQVGFTRLVAGYLVWKIITTRNFNVYVVAPTLPMSANLLRYVRSIIEEMGRDMVDIPRITANNKHSIELANGSCVRAVYATVESFKSVRPDMIVIEEAAFIKDMAKLWVDVVMPMYRYNSRLEVIVASSPAGAGLTDWFNMAWKLSVEGHTDLNPVRINKSMVPTFTIKSRREMIEIMGKGAYLTENG